MQSIQLTLNSSSPTPVYLKLAETLETAIENGSFKAGDKMPSTRELSRIIGVSRPTIIAAYEVLLGRNLVEMRMGCGVYVAPVILPAESGRSRPPLEREIKSHLSRRSLSCAAALESWQERWRLFNPPSYAVPAAKWKRIAGRHDGKHDPANRDFESETFGMPKLKRTLISYIRRVRGIPCQDNDIVVFSNTHQSITAVLHLMLNEGDTVVCEDSIPRALHDLLRLSGAEIVFLPVDKGGLSLASLSGLCPAPKLVVINPTHQGLSATSLPPERRAELVQWAATANSFILELDEDHFFARSSPPHPAVSALDRHGHCIYISSFSSSLSSLSRLSFVALPPDLVGPMKSLKGACHPCDLPLAEQSTLSDFISEGHLEVAVRHAKRDFSERLRAFIIAATRMLPDLIVSRTANQFFLLTEWDGAVAPAEFKEIADRTLLSFTPAGTIFSSAGINQFILPFAHYSPREMSQALEEISRAVNLAVSNYINFEPGD